VEKTIVRNMVGGFCIYRTVKPLVIVLSGAWEELMTGRKDKWWG
jgi:hypothetical protein